MDGTERRKNKRLGAKFDISCRKVGSTEEKSYRGYTMNVSPGGLYFETAVGTFKPGSLLEVELSIPPKAGILEFGGRISGFARVLRTDAIHVSPVDTDLSSAGYGVALQFCRSPRLCM
ncbi:MAG: PilZ domain-containing protein [Planctomycetota bacterium]